MYYTGQCGGWRIAYQYTIRTYTVVRTSVSIVSRVLLFLISLTYVTYVCINIDLASDREGWPYVDALPDNQVCEPQPATDKLPIGLHYCGRYFLGKVRTSQMSLDLAELVTFLGMWYYLC
jgi:hypothetical protein